MKRSEMIRKFACYLDQINLGVLRSNPSASSLKEANAYLKAFEKLGMKPPTYYEPGYSGLNEVGVYYEDPDYAINEWEPEDEIQKS